MFHDYTLVFISADNVYVWNCTNERIVVNTFPYERKVNGPWSTLTQHISLVFYLSWFSRQSTTERLFELHK